MVTGQSKRRIKSCDIRESKERRKLRQIKSSGKGRLSRRFEVAHPDWVSYEGKLRQIKSVGIRKRKGRVNPRYGVEFRPPNSAKLIWLGTFSSRRKAKLAFDAALYLVGKEPFYHVYDEGYFPPRLSQILSKESLQQEAKKYAEMTGGLVVNPSSLLPDTLTSVPPGSPFLGVGSHQPKSTSMVGQMIIPTDVNLLGTVVEPVDAPPPAAQIESCDIRERKGRRKLWQIKSSGKGRLSKRSEVAHPDCVSYEGKLRQIKSVGIRERKGRVNPRYGVEFRPPNSAKLIWLGTFSSRRKAKLAFDAALYLVGKEPFYHVYDEGYFPPRLSQILSKESLQQEAKKYAEMTGGLVVNPSSLLPDTLTSVPPGSPFLGVGSHQTKSTSMVGQMIIPTDVNLLGTVVESVDAPPPAAEIEPSKLLTPIQAHLPNEVFQASPMVLTTTPPWLNSEDPQAVDLEEDDGSEVKFEDDDEIEVAPAYMRGFNAPNTSAVTFLVEQIPPEHLNVFPHIEGGSHILDALGDTISNIITSERRRESSNSDFVDWFEGSDYWTSDLLFHTTPEDRFVHEGSEMPGEEWYEHLRF